MPKFVKLFNGAYVNPDHVSFVCPNMDKDGNLIPDTCTIVITGNDPEFQGGLICKGNVEDIVALLIS